jgi:hypothetical protein
MWVAVHSYGPRRPADGGFPDVVAGRKFFQRSALRAPLAGFFALLREEASTVCDLTYARRVLREVGGASYCTIRKIAKDAGIKLQRGGNHRHPKTQPA